MGMKALLNLGYNYRELGYYEPAIKMLSGALEIAQEIEDYNTERIALDNLGTAYRRQKNYAQAIDYSDS